MIQKKLPIRQIITQIYRKDGTVGIIRRFSHEYPEIVASGVMGAVGIGMAAYLIFFSGVFSKLKKYPGNIAILRPDDPLVPYLPKYDDGEKKM